MKNLKITILLFILILPMAANAQSSKVASLISAIARNYPQTSNSYTLVEIGSTGYLIKGSSPKVLKTKKISGGVGGMCENYASVSTFASNQQMKKQSEGEGSIWKYDGKSWKEIARTSAGDWQCSDVKGIPKAARKCLGASECY